jgi:hypothetical protein
MKAQDKKRDVPEQLRDVAGMDRCQCRQAWIQAFNAYPPKYLSIPFMQRVVAHELQCRILGGYPVATRRALKQVIVGKDASEVVQAVGDGATLVREWNGRVYRVEARTEGYVLDGRTYTSLSAVARHITGARWSGPRFFGLNGKRSA